MPEKGIFDIDFFSYKKSVGGILKKAGLDKLVSGKRTIILKPNLTTNLPSPCTTPAELVEEVIKFLQANSKAKIIIAEGAGGIDTLIPFKDLGYEELSYKYKVILVDLNREKRIHLENDKAKVLKKVFLPEILFNGFLINLPVLKCHDSAVLTCTAKNLFGIYLNRNFIFRCYGFLKCLKTSPSKSELHFLYGVHPSIYDLNLYCRSDFVLVDASIGQKGNEIHGCACNPPIKKLIAGFDNLQIDKYCAPFLGLDPKKITYLNY